IAAGPRIINSSQGPIPLSPSGLDGYQQAQQNGQLSFTVTFDRPINPPGTTASFTRGDVQVFYQDTTFGDPSIPLQVLSVDPVNSSGVGPLGKFGYTTFKVTFSTAGVTNFTGTYSYLIAPDDSSGNPIQQAIPSYVDTNVQQSLIGP